MALQLIPNQPVILNPEEECCPDCGQGIFCQHYGPLDKLIWQAKQTPCEEIDPCWTFDLGDDIVKNGTFTDNADNWTLTGWTWTPDKICWHEQAFPVSAVQSIPSLIENKAYQLIYTLSGYAAAGSVTPILGGTAGITRDSDGTYTEIIVCGSGTDLEFSAIGQDGCIDDVSLREYSFCWVIDDVYWDIDVANNRICRTVGGADPFSASVNILPDSYYKITLEISEATAGSVTIGMWGNVSSDNTSGNGIFEIWCFSGNAGNPIQIYCSPDFNGCVQVLKIERLKNDFAAQIINSDTEAVIADITEFIEYYHDWITINELWSNLVDNFGCYKLAIYNTCCQCSTEQDPACFTINGNIDLLPPEDLIIGDYYITLSGNVVLWDGESQIIQECPSGVVYDITNNQCLKFNGLEWRIVPCIDKCNIVCNGDFETPEDNPEFCWTDSISGDVASNFIEGHWEISFISGDPAIAMISQPFELCKCSVYDVCFDYDSEIDFDWHFKITRIFPFIIVQENTGTGLAGKNRICFSFGLSSNLDISPELLISLAITAGAIGKVKIDNFIITKRPFDISTGCPDYISNCLTYKETLDCTDRILMGYSDNPAFGFEFITTGFRLQLRCKFDLSKSNYDSEISEYIYSNGVRALSFAQSEKFKVLSISQVDEITHDAIEKIRLLKHFFLGDCDDVLTEYVSKKGNYTPEWKGIIKVANSKFEVSKKGDIGFSTNCS